MTHVTDEQLVAFALGDATPEADAAIQGHLDACAACREELAEIRRVLDAAASIDAPPRGADYGAEVWARLEPRLDAVSQTPRVRVPRWFAAAAAVLLAVSAFIVGRWSGTTPVGPDRAGAAPAAEVGQIRERVVRAALRDHFDRAERAMLELANADPSARIDITAEQAWARDLLEANRLYRQSAPGAAAPALVELLDELEPILLEIVNSPGRLTPDELHALQARIEDRSLVFKLRVTTASLRSQQRMSAHPGEPTS